MNSKLLIDSIMRQTTVLIAQLSTAAGIRAPLSHIADQVFVELAREIEAQGVSRKVVADMFGLALRTYQKKVQRLTESAGSPEQTLWQAVLDYLRSESRSRSAVLSRFKHDGDREIGAVLNDLLNSGLVYCTGRGAGALFGLTSDADRKALLLQHDLDSVASMLWLKVHLEEPLAADGITTTLGPAPELVSDALALLLKDGRLAKDENGNLIAQNFVVPLNSEQGWEAAVFDHFRAVATAIAGKLRRGKLHATEKDIIGGATLSFSIHSAHPKEAQVLDLLRSIRSQVGDLWKEVSDYNAANPAAPERTRTVTFYFGQNVDSDFDSESESNHEA